MGDIPNNRMQLPDGTWLFRMFTPMKTVKRLAERAGWKILEISEASASSEGNRKFTMIRVESMKAEQPLLPAFAGYMPRQRNVVYCVDALTLLRAMDSQSVDLIVTSPPYDNLRAYKGYTWDFEAIAHQSYRVLKTGGVMVWVVGDATIDGSETLSSFEQALYFKKTVGFRMHDTMIYKKNCSGFPDTTRYYQDFEYMFVLSKGSPKATTLQQQPSRWAGSKSFGKKSQRNGNGELEIYGKQTVKPLRTMSNVWDINTGYGYSTKDTIAYEHPATFPEALAERHILTWSNPGDLVVDFFGGSGTTAKMARNNNRHYITCDISSEYCDLMRRRLSMPFTPNMFEGIAS